MMMGQTKKKIIIAAVVSFLIPSVIGGCLFMSYDKKMKAEIETLKIKSATVKRYALNKSLAEGDLITPEDLKVIEVKKETAPLDSFSGDVGNKTEFLSQIVNRRIVLDAEANTVVTKSMFFAEADKEPGLTERFQEFNMFTLPSDLEEGDFIDVRISLPIGENYVVISGKEVKSLGSTADTNTIFLQLDEEEILRSTAAVIDSYMTKGAEIYVNKYVKPNTQLYNSDRVDLVAAYKKAVEELIAEKQALLSGDNSAVSGDNLAVSGDATLTSGEQTKTIEPIIITEADITAEEIALKSGIDIDMVNNIKIALDSQNEQKLSIYRSWLVKTKNNMVNNYPIKSNVAKLIKSNPNILKEIQDKYNIAELEAQRAHILEQPLYVIDPYDGTVVESEQLNKIEEELKKKIDIQKNERREYLQALILAETK